MALSAARTSRSVLAAIGLIDGLLSGLLGIGGAVFLVPVLATIGKLTQHQAHGTALATVPLVAITSGLIYGAGGNLDLALASVIVVTSTIGAVTGARVMRRLPALALRRVFAVFLFILGMRMVVG